MDFLTLCPSLIDILQLVEYEDILNCNLINRSIYDVIHNNAKSMPKKKTDLLFRTLIEETTGTPYILIQSDLTHCHIYITPDRTILADCPKRVADHYRVHGKIGVLVSRTIAEELIMMNVQERIGQDKITKIIYDNDSILDGLRTIWTLLFCNYKCETADLDGPMPDEWIDLLSECCEIARAKCSFLITSLISPALKRLLVSLECWIIVRFPNKDDTLISDLQEIIRWDIDTTFDFSKYYVASILHFSTFLKMWCNGECSLNKVVFFCRDIFDEKNMIRFPRDIDEMLQNLNQDTVDISDIVEFESRNIMIRRKSDNRFLSIIVKWGETIELFDENRLAFVEREKLSPLNIHYEHFVLKC